MSEEGMKPWRCRKRCQPALGKWEMLVTVWKKDEEARTAIEGESPEERDTQAAAGATEWEECCRAWWTARTDAERKSKRRLMKESHSLQKCVPSRISLVKISARFILPATWRTFRVPSWTHSRTKFSRNSIWHIRSRTMSLTTLILCQIVLKYMF